MQYNIWSAVSCGQVLVAFMMVLFSSSLKVKLHGMEQLTISLTNWLSIDDECVVFEFGVHFTFFDTEFSWLFIFHFSANLVSADFGFKGTLVSGGFGFDASLASRGFADSVMLKMVSLGQFIRAVLKLDDLSKI